MGSSAPRLRTRLAIRSGPLWDAARVRIMLRLLRSPKAGLVAPAAELAFRRSMIIRAHKREDAPHFVVGLHDQPHGGHRADHVLRALAAVALGLQRFGAVGDQPEEGIVVDRKSTRLNSSH